MATGDYIETMGSPVITGDRLRIERIYSCKHGTGATLLSNYTDNGSYTDGYFDAEASSCTGGVYDTVRLVFNRYLDGSVSGTTRTIYDLDNTPTARDIRLHEDYVAKWRYNLYQYCKNKDKSSYTPTLPAWWDTATDIEVPAEDAGKYQWGESTPSSDSQGAWYLVAQRTVAADTYPYPAPTVQETKYCGSRSSASAIVQTAGTCVKPGQTFGIGGDTSNWQVTHSGTHKEGRKWVVTTSYQYAPNGWDGRIIPGGVAEGGEL